MSDSISNNWTTDLAFLLISNPIIASATAYDEHNRRIERRRKNRKICKGCWCGKLKRRKKNKKIDTTERRREGGR